MTVSPAAAAALRAAAEVFVPGPPYDPTPGAGELGVERFIADYLDFILPGMAEGVPGLLDQIARERFEGRDFASLRLSEREIVLEALEHHEIEQLRELPELLGMLTVAAVYGEWTGQDEAGRVIRPPWGWTQTGFTGPVRERPHLMRP